MPSFLIIRKPRLGGKPVHLQRRNWPCDQAHWRASGRQALNFGSDEGSLREGLVLAVRQEPTAHYDPNGKSVEDPRTVTGWESDGAQREKWKVMHFPLSHGLILIRGKKSQLQNYNLKENGFFFLFFLNYYSSNTMYVFFKGSKDTCM